MIAIQLRFPTGKYHATPWGRQVNEGAVEWPPSPWRLLRALLAVWHHKFSDVPEEEMRELIEALLSPPAYHLPPTSQGHTRHYMPAANDAKTKIFDTFVAVSPANPVVVCWPDIQLRDSQASLLSRLLNAMSYFGRAESWVAARLCTDYDGSLDVRPLDGTNVEQSQELIRLLSPVSPIDYQPWRKNMLTEIKERKLEEKRHNAARKGKPPENVKLSPKEIKALEAALPADVFDALHAQTNDLRKAGWNRPPASRWVEYVGERTTLPMTSPARIAKAARPTVARYAIAGSVRPRLTEALWIGERARQYVMGCSKKQNGGQCSAIFSGKGSNGRPRRDDHAAHAHAHYLCESSGLNSRGRITHLTVFVPSGIGDADEAALARFTRVWGHDGHDLQVVLLGIGQPQDFGGLDDKRGQSPLLGAGRVWTSRTPFVPTDHLRIRNGERHDADRFAQAVERELGRVVRRELSRRPWLEQHAASVTIERIPHTDLGGTSTSWLKFRRERKHGHGRQSTTQGYGFKLIFAEAVQGPIALGYGCHFGLGQFVAGDASQE
ncbi:MAG: type I-U CRISPR-associated protein Csb2 [Candidatus Paceibacterota bacterium]